MSADRVLLHDGWVLDVGRHGGRLGTDSPTVPAQVPGSVHLDLYAAGLIDDPYLDRNELAVQWIGESAWTYRVEFDTEVGQGRAALVFEGIDGFATIGLNGTTLGRAENQHRTYRYDVTDLLKRSGNVLVLDFDPPATHAIAVRERVGDLPNPFGTPFNFVRKMACNFGWDWGPQLTTSGLWRPVLLDRWQDVRIKSVHPIANVRTEAPVADEAGRVDVTVDLDFDTAVTPHAIVRVHVAAQDGDVAGRGEAIVEADMSSVAVAVDVPTVARWWPRGYGDQPLYRIDVAVEVAGIVADRATTTLGFRTVRLDTSEQPDGQSFAIFVNGERIWVRGVNWIPADCFPSRNTGDLVVGLLGEAVAANANLVRVWGGGVYESDEFYDECDRLGLLVWQDFPFACAAYPEELLHEEVVAEAAGNISRLLPHPSLTLWCGNNECLQGWTDWGWQPIVGDRSWGEGFYRSLLPEIVGRLDPTRPYIDGSPTSLASGRHPNDPHDGTVHLWDVWNERDYELYRSHRPRFVAEFGFQAPPTLATITSAVSARPLDVDAPELQHHQKAVDGASKLQRALVHHFGEVTGFDDWLYLTQVNQARAIDVGVGHFRALHERCSGVVWWQLDDCWPAISWSVVDRAGRRKPSWYALRRSFADRLLVLDPGGVADLDLVLVNDTAHAWEVAAEVRELSPAGDLLGGADLETTVAPRSSARIALPSGAERADGLTVATAGQLRAVYGGAGADRRLIPPRWDVAVEVDGVAIDVAVTAHTFVRDLCLFADRVDPDAVVDDQLVTLLPGEIHRFEVHRSGRIDPASWIDRLSGDISVLRAVGDRRTR